MANYFRTSVFGDNIRRVAFAVFTALLFSAIATPQPASAQKYPERQVRIILPFGAGGVADVIARLTSEKMTEKLGQRFVIENMPGAGGIAAARAVMSAPADGYTLALMGNSAAIAVPLFSNLTYNPQTDFVPVSMMGDFDFIFVTQAGSPYKTLGDVIKAAKDKPGQIKIGTITVGSTQNLSGELFKSTAGVNVTIVPFKTSPEVMVAVVRGDVQMGIENYSAEQAQITEKTVVPVASSGADRTIFLPNVPTVKEAGGGNFEARSWNAIFAPKGTPPEIVRTLSAAFQEVLNDPVLKKKALEMGIDAKGSQPEIVQQRMKDDIALWTKVIETAGIPKQ